MAPEPRLREADLECWRQWQRAALTHSRSIGHRRAVDAAKRVADLCMGQVTNPAVMWSGGKDSTCLTHLLRVGMGLDVQVYSEKDDLDFPGEETYVTDLAAAWGARLQILRPTISPAAWFEENAHRLEVGGDIHSRAAGLSKECFYRVVEEASRPHDGIFLGLRAEESRHRKADRYSNVAMLDGRTVLDLYQYRSGERAGTWKCQPIGGWSGLDVMAYMIANDIEPLPIYKCVALMHSRDPWRIRKSWWVPGQGAERHGGIAWLRFYFPSLYQRFCGWMPEARYYT